MYRYGDKMKNIVFKKNLEISIKGKKYSINIIKFSISILILILLFFVISDFLGSKKINTNTDITKINANKYSKQILAEYEKDGMEQSFLEYYEKLQTAIGMYIFNNSTLDSNSFSDISKTLNEDLKNSKLEKLGMDKSTLWNGNFSIDENGVLKFKFANKGIEPSWIKDDKLQSKVILN